MRDRNDKKVGFFSSLQLAGLIVILVICKPEGLPYKWLVVIAIPQVAGPQIAGSELENPYYNKVV